MILGNVFDHKLTNKQFMWQLYKANTVYPEKYIKLTQVIEKR